MERNEREARENYGKVTETRASETSDNGLQPESETKERKKRKAKEKEVEA